MSQNSNAKAKWTWEDWTLVTGVASGLAAFLVVGLVPALVYGGYAALGLFSEMTGGPVESSIASRAFIVIGMVLSVVATGALFATGGAVAGLVGVGFGKVGLMLTGAKAPAPKATEATQSTK